MFNTCDKADVDLVLKSIDTESMILCDSRFHANEEAPSNTVVWGMMGTVI